MPFSLGFLNRREVVILDLAHDEAIVLSAPDPAEGAAVDDCGAWVTHLARFIDFARNMRNAHSQSDSTALSPSAGPAPNNMSADDVLIAALVKRNSKKISAKAPSLKSKSSSYNIAEMPFRECLAHALQVAANDQMALHTVQDLRAMSKDNDTATGALGGISPKAGSTTPVAGGRGGGEETKDGGASGAKETDTGENDDGGAASPSRGTPTSKTSPTSPALPVEGDAGGAAGGTAGVVGAGGTGEDSNTGDVGGALGGEAVAGGEGKSGPSIDMLQDIDFKAKSKHVLSEEGVTFEFRVYAPRVFRCLRDAFGVSNDAYAESLQQLTGGVVGDGKSGMLFFQSSNRDYVIKTVKESEKDFFFHKTILQQYTRHMVEYKDTLLCRFYGLYKIRFPKQKNWVVLIVMRNTFQTPLPIHAKFDLKGTVHMS